VLEALRRHAVLVVIAALGAVCSVAAALYVRRAVDMQEDARFLQAITGSTDTIRDRLNAYSGMLRSARSLFEALGREPDGAEFHAFVEGLEVGRFYRGVQGVGWAKALAPGEVAAHEHAVRRATSQPGYRVWPEGVRDTYSSIVMLEPLDWRNQRAIGFDMYSEPVRRDAMARARDSGDVAASGKVELVQEAGSERQAGFLMYLPVYRSFPETPEQRRKLLLGWVYAPFRADDLLRNTLGSAAGRAVGLAVYDAPTPAPGTLLHDDGLARLRAHRVAEQHLEVAGRTWTIRYVATAAFSSLPDRFAPWAVLAVGLGLTLLMVWITRSEVLARTRAEHAATRTAFLAEAGKLLASELDYRLTLPEVVRLASGRVADVCLASVVEPEQVVWFAPDADHDGDGWRAALVEAGLDPQAQVGAAAAIRARAPQLLEGKEDLSRVPFVARSPRLAERMRAARVRSALTVPLLSRDQPIGAISLLSAEERFAREDVALAQDLARLAAAAIDTARLTWRAQEAVRARDEFLSIASHELKTPLTSLALQSDSLRLSARRGDAEALIRKVEVIRRSVDRLARLVGSLLDLSRITAGHLELEVEEVDLADVAREVVGRFEEEALRAGCALRLDAPAPVTGQWDRMRLDQVLTNLLANAVKYGPGKPVDVRVQGEPGRAVITVRDHGIGISAADQQRIFERFERAVSKRNYGGFGLGLWIVREIVEALGGAVRVESAPGLGSTFTVELTRPLAAPAPRRDAAPTPP
jgi:signal transduction histidine kinase